MRKSAHDFVFSPSLALFDSRILASLQSVGLRRVARHVDSRRRRRQRLVRRLLVVDAVVNVCLVRSEANTQLMTDVMHSNQSNTLRVDLLF